MNILNGLGGTIPVNNLSDEQKRILILTWVSKNLKIRWKDYNMQNVPTANSARINIAGRSGRNSVPNQIGRLYDLELDKDKVAGEIIDFSLQVLFNMFTEIEESENSSRRIKYMVAIDNPDFLSMLLQIAVILTAKQIISDGYDLRHKTLETRLQAAEEKKYELTQIWKNYSKNIIGLDIAISNTERIFEEFERQVITATGLDHELMSQEKALLQLVGEENTVNYALGILEHVRTSFSHQQKLFSSF
ncbi:MAG: hypothetical protein ACRCU6_00245 [Fusobacteriaceae bacterium]